MSWLLLALLAPAIYSLVVFVDKYIVSKEVKDYQAMPFYSAITGFFAGTLFWIIAGFPLLNLKDTVFVFLTGILTIFSFAAYFKAAATEEASTINILFQMEPVLVLILAFLFLGEHVIGKELLGFMIIFISVFSISIEKRDSKLRLSKAFFLLLLYDILWAFSAILMKGALHENSFFKEISYFGWGVGFGGLLIYILVGSMRRAFNKSLKEGNKRAMLLIVSNEGLFLLGRSITYLAYAIGSVTLVSVLEGTQVFYGILLGWLTMFIAPKIFKEDVTRKNLTKKIIFAMVLMGGIWLLH